MPIWLIWILLGGGGFTLLVVIAYKFRDAFILFEGICLVLDVILEILSSIDIGD